MLSQMYQTLLNMSNITLPLFAYYCQITIKNQKEHLLNNRGLHETLYNYQKIVIE